MTIEATDAKLRRRRRIVAALIAAFSIWPLLHYQMVRRFDSSAWKLFGWAMYTRPRYVPTVEVYRFDEQSGRRAVVFAEPRFAEAEAERRRFIEWAEAIGTLASPDRLAVATARALGEDEGALEVVVLRFRIDRETGFVAVDRDSRFYAPEDLGGARSAESES